jgi:Domain of unknown function DUF29
MSKYEDDFYAWTQVQVGYLREGDWNAVDAVHVAEVIEAIGMNEKRAISHQLQRLLTHLLKWRYQPTHRTPSWRRSIRQARDMIADVIENSHTLDDYPAQRLRLAYRRARRDAAEDTGLPLATVPESCEWSVDEIRREGFFPRSDEEERAGSAP